VCLAAQWKESPRQSANPTADGVGVAGGALEAWWIWGAPAVLELLPLHLHRLLPLVIRSPVHNHCARTFSIDFPCDAAQLESFEYGAHDRPRSVKPGKKCSGKCCPTGFPHAHMYMCKEAHNCGQKNSDYKWFTKLLLKCIFLKNPLGKHMKNGFNIKIVMI